MKVMLSCRVRLACSCSPFHWTSAALSVPPLRHVVLLFDQRNAVQSATSVAKSEVTGQRLEMRKGIAQSFYHAYKMTIYTCFILLR
ncbi:hypothetical protein J3E68DRAFT_409287 [Trichoderma sp. SZMC 28012]